MSKTSKLTGLAKIWREIKRPFKKIGHRIKLSVRDILGFNDLACLIQHELADIGLADIVRSGISTSILHQQTFSKFKNIHRGQEIVLVATGPSAKDYKRIGHAIHIGVNRAFQIDNIDLHYLFIQDYGMQPYMKKANQYRPEHCIKFYGLLDLEPGILIPESDAIEANAMRYRTDWSPHCSYKFSHLIDSEPLGDFESVSFSAMQFALWTNPRIIYLVGCDCTSQGHFDGLPSRYESSHQYGAPSFVPRWKQLKEFAQLYYPETEIKSINPVGLKGIFNE
jgi:hypothetical protein